MNINELCEYLNRLGYRSSQGSQISWRLVYYGGIRTKKLNAKKGKMWQVSEEDALEWARNATINPGCISQVEAAEILGLSRQRICQFVAEGRLPRHMTREDVESFSRERKEK